MKAKHGIMLMLIVAGMTSACENLPAAPEGPAVNPSAYRTTAFGPAERVLEEYVWDLDGIVLPLECPGGTYSDDVMIEGSVVERYMLITDGNGSAHMRVHTMPVGMRGVSVHSGEQYRVREREQRSAMQHMNGSTGSYRQTLSMFGRDSHHKFDLVFSGHYRQGPDGETVVERNQLKIDCR